jgi:hypothetical protein
VLARRTITAEIAKDGICTQITAVKLPAENQQAVVDLMIERARFMVTQPGFVAVNLEKLEAAHHSPEFRRKWPQFGKLANAIEPGLYDVAYSNAA